MSPRCLRRSPPHAAPANATQVGTPIVVLSRSNTTQHMYRWAQMLIELCAKHGVDPGMVTYVAAARHEQGRLFAEASARVTAV